MRVWLLLAGALALSASPLSRRIEEVWKSDPAAARAVWGICALDAASGKPLVEFNGSHFFIPASNTKLLTTALALVRLGPDFRFHTRVTSRVPIGAGGVLDSDLRLVGDGDPNLSGREIPYRKDSPPGDPLAAMDRLAAELERKGLRQVRGGIIGDDTAFVWEPYAPGWAVEDIVSADGPAVSAISLNDNEIALTVAPGSAPGEPGAITVEPALDYFTIDNRVVTGPAGGEWRVQADREPGSRVIHVCGEMAPRDPPVSLRLAVDDPALFAAAALRDALERRGIHVLGGLATRHRFTDRIRDLGHGRPRQPRAAQAVELASLESPPVIEYLRVIDKVSQNLHAEMMLRTVARARRGIGSRQAGIEELKQFLNEAGVRTDDIFIRDGSGLSRMNLVTPAAVAQLLVYMNQTPWAAAWRSLLPVGGEDGTLQYRFRVRPRGVLVQAKTGSLAHVSALAGYVQAPGGRLVAFSILVNNYQAPDVDIRQMIDRISLTLVE